MRILRRRLPPKEVRQHIERKVSQWRHQRAASKGAELQQQLRKVQRAARVRLHLSHLETLCKEQVDRFVEVAADAMWHNYGRVSESEKEWILKRCSEIVNNYQAAIKQKGKELAVHDGRLARVCANRCTDRLRPDLAGKRKLESMIRDRELERRSKRREAPLRARWWWALAILVVALVGALVPILLALLRR
ncbi:MAG: hypothetical protein ACLF0G_11385 [Candidatus Brocadiia bacterium]